MIKRKHKFDAAAKRRGKKVAIMHATNKTCTTYIIILLMALIQFLLPHLIYLLRFVDSLFAFVRILLVQKLLQYKRIIFLNAKFVYGIKYPPKYDK